jgi:hypothetical protein
MFKKFMNNDKKRAMAEAQGLLLNKESKRKTPRPLMHSEFDNSGLMDFLDSLVEGNRRAQKVKNTPFEELEEAIPSYEPIKKNITIKRVNRQKIKPQDDTNLRPSSEEPRGAITLDTTNNYTILGLTEGATDEEIKSAYRKLVRKLHPDKTGGDKELTEKFRIVDNAYKKLITKEDAQADAIIQAQKFCQSSIENITARMGNAILALNRLQSEDRNEKSAKNKKRIQAEIAEQIERINSYDDILKDLKSELSELAKL